MLDRTNPCPLLGGIFLVAVSREAKMDIPANMVLDRTSPRSSTAKRARLAANPPLGGIAMKFTAFLLDQWLQQHAGAEFNLGGSTGPRWTPRQLLALAGDGAAEKILDLNLDHPPTAGSSNLREAIAEMQGLLAEQVVVLAGSAEALFHIFYLAMESGANVVVPFPCFPAHKAIPESLGFEIRHYHLRPENSYRIDLGEVKRLADRRTKIILVNSPHNPTGATLSNDEMRALHDFSAERGIQFVSDEVFHPIYHGPPTDPAARLSRATVVGDFSKALSLPGLRLGWIVERDRDRRREYMNAREYVTISNTPLGEFLGEIAIRHHDQLLRRTQEVANTNLALLDRVFAEHADALDWVRPRGGMTAFARLVSGGNARLFCQEAIGRGLLLAPGDCWGVPDHFRIGFGVGLEWYPHAMARFSELLRAWCRAAPARSIA
jgi:aspartate/methionine/tyrosine aminotransferase